MTEQVRETIDRLEEFKEPLIKAVATLQGVPQQTQDGNARIWAFITSTAHAIRDGRARTYSGIEEHCFKVLSAFDPSVSAVPIDPPVDPEDFTEAKKTKKLR